MGRISPHTAESGTRREAIGLGIVMPTWERRLKAEQATSGGKGQEQVGLHRGCRHAYCFGWNGEAGGGRIGLGSALRVHHPPVQ